MTQNQQGKSLALRYAVIDEGPPTPPCDKCDNDSLYAERLQRLDREKHQYAVKRKRSNGVNRNTARDVISPVQQSVTTTSSSRAASSSAGSRAETSNGVAPRDDGTTEPQIKVEGEEEPININEELLRLERDRKPSLMRELKTTGLKGRSRLRSGSGTNGSAR